MIRDNLNLHYIVHSCDGYGEEINTLSDIATHTTLKFDKLIDTMEREFLDRGLNSFFYKDEETAMNALIFTVDLYNGFFFSEKEDTMKYTRLITSNRIN